MELLINDLTIRLKSHSIIINMKQDELISYWRDTSDRDNVTMLNLYRSGNKKIQEIRQWLISRLNQE
jgi:hypothetical protein